MHSKFKEEINHHLQECKSTLEELEAYETELKGNAERQSMQKTYFGWWKMDTYMFFFPYYIWEHV